MFFCRKYTVMPKADCGTCISTEETANRETAQKTTIPMIQKRSFLFKVHTQFDLIFKASLSKAYLFVNQIFHYNLIGICAIKNLFFVCFSPLNLCINKSAHFRLINLNTRLVEGENTQKQTAYGAGFFKKVSHIPK